MTVPNPFMPQYPQVPQGPMPQQYVPPMPQYPQPQQYAPQPQYAPPAAPAPVPVQTGSLDQFFAQPSVSGGPSWTFKDKPTGTTYVGIVERAIQAGDVQQQTIPGTNQPATFRDGSPKWMMKVPMLQQPDAEHPEGKATWYCTGQARDELVRAMAEAGCPQDVINAGPEGGAGVMLQLTQRKPARTAGFNPSNIVAIRYQRPQGAATAAPVAEAPQQNVTPASEIQPSEAQQWPNPQPVAAPAPFPTPAPMQPPAPMAPPVAQVAAPLAPAGGSLPAPDGMSDEQTALLAKLTGQQQ